MQETALSLMVLTTVALIVGAIYLWLSRGLKKQAVLMVILAAVMAVNVAILTVPNDRGESLVGAKPE